MSWNASEQTSRCNSAINNIEITVPESDTDTSLDLTAGDWRVLADFTPSGTGEKLTLGADVAVAGEYTPQPLPRVSTEASVDGYAVTASLTRSIDPYVTRM